MRVLEVQRDNLNRPLYNKEVFQIQIVSNINFM